MKELEIKAKDKMEVSVEKLQKKENTFLGSIRLKRGHSIWEINPKDDTIQKAKYSITDYIVGQDNRKTIIINKDCIYIPALNRKNALKKFINSLVKKNKK